VTGASVSSAYEVASFAEVVVSSPKNAITDSKNARSWTDLADESSKFDELAAAVSSTLEVSVLLLPAGGASSTIAAA